MLHKKAFYQQGFLAACSKKHLVAVALGAFLLFISNIVSAMESDEERQPYPLQTRVAVSSISTLKDLDARRDHSLFSPQDDLKKLEAYSKKLFEYNIRVDNVLDPEKKELRLTFNKVWRLLSFHDVSYEPIFSMFPNIPSILATLDISGKALSLQELEHAVDLARNNTSIVHVAVNSIHQRNPWTEDGRAHCLLAALTLRNSLLKGLVTELSYHFFSESNLEEDAISEGLKNSTSIKRVDFLLNGGKRKSLIGSLKESKELESIAITLYGCNLIPTEVNDLTYLIASPLSLKSLKLEVLFDDFLILSLATALKEKAISLEQLTLISAKETEKEEKIKTETMKSLFKAISTNKSLQVLRLRLPLSLQSFQDFAECLKANTTLKVLALPENYISDQNVSSLAEGVKENNSLTTIDLSFNSISDSGADSLLNMLNVNSTLESLYLFHNKIGYSKKMAIAQALHQRRPIAFIEGKTSE